MISLKGKTVLITGASAGIGAACAEQCAAAGARLIITARRIEKLKTMAANLAEQYQVEVLPLSLDVRDRAAVTQGIEQLPAEWQAIDILVNNAGLALGTDPLYAGDIDQWETMIDTNIKGLLFVTRAILPGMIERQCGHVINIGSIAGHETYPNGNVYSATKHAVRALSKSMRLDLLGQPIRVTDVAPGVVHTEFSRVRWDDHERAEQFYAGFANTLRADDIADCVVYVATRPNHVNINEILVTPVCQASANHVQLKNSGSGSTGDLLSDD